MPKHKRSSSKSPKRHRRIKVSKSHRNSLIAYDNAEERMHRSAATQSMNWATRRRAIAALVVLGSAIGIGVLVWYFSKKTPITTAKEAEIGEGDPIIGLVTDKQQQCYQAADCPDGTYCGRRGYCIPAEMQPPLEGDAVLGRGRGGEGSNIFLSSLNRRGQT